MTINSRYKILQILGEGRSNVYLVEDLKSTNKKYALKILSTENLTEDEINSLKYEFRLLNKLNHPHIVKAYEFGKVVETDDEKFKGLYFYISEFIQGKNLLEFFNEPFNKNNLKKFFVILNQISTTLYYIHQLGLIHCDIRPENILIEEKNGNQINIKLIDFGFSALQSKGIRGTPLYISPELIKGQNVNFKTDLYSLGATLYHTLTGKPPFVSEDNIELLKKHLDESPPTLPANEFPSFINELLQNLLRKNPQERLNNALEILDYLPKEYQHFQKIWPIPKTYFARDKELKTIIDFINSSEVENRIKLIISEAGMGKSYLINKLLDYLDDQNLTFFHLNYSEEMTSSQDLLFYLVNQIERFLLHKNIPSKPDIIEKIHQLRQLYAELEKPLDFQENQRSILSEILIKLAKESKFIIIIDDFHKFDSTAKKFLYFVYPSLVDQGVKIIITTNTKFIRSDEIKNLRLIDEIILGPLSKKEILKQLNSYFHFDFPYEEVADILINYTDKSVGEINDFLGSLIRSEILIFDSKGFRLNDNKLKQFDLENLLTKTYDSRLANLNDNQKAILEILSLIDFPLKAQQLSELTSLHINELRDEISFLSSFGWLEYSEWDDIVFLPKSGIKNILLNNTKFDKKLNLKLAEYFVHSGHPNSIIAHFYERAGIKLEAIKYYQKAALEAENYFSFSLMERFLSKCIELEEDENKIYNLKYKLASSYFYQSDYEKARALITEIIDKNILDREQLFNIFLMLAIISFKTGNIESAYEYFDKSFTLALNDNQKIEVELYQINLEISQGNFMIAMKKCQNLLSVYKEELTPNINAAIYNNLGITNSQLGYLDEAIRYFEKALDVYTELKNRSKTSQVLLNLGNVHNLLGEREKSLNYWQEALKINDTTGDLSNKALILNNIGISLFENFELDRAVSYYEDSKNIFDKINDHFGKSIALVNLAETCYLLCEYEKSLKYSQDALELSKNLFDIEGQCISLFLLGMVYFSLNQIDRASEIANELLSLIECNRMQSTHLQFYLYLSGLIEFENKNIEEAETKLDLSRELFKESDGKHFYCKCTLDLMRLYEYQGNFDLIKKLFDELQTNSYFTKNSLLNSEAYLIMGDASKKPGSHFEKTPIYYYLEALKHLENAHIGEVTWQVLLSLGEEYLRKGAIGKGVELFKQSRLVIDYLISKIEKANNKNSYLAQVKRRRAIDKLEKVINNY